MTTKIVDVLREWKKVDTEYSAVFAQMKDLEVAKWDDDMRDIYLRGYDDRQSEITALHGEVQYAKFVNDVLTARVWELETQLAVRPQPAVVGVVGSVRWGVELSPDNVRFCDSRKEAEQYAASWSPVSSVVAIVDPAQIVPLASATPLNRCVDSDGLLYWKADKSVRADAKLYVAAQALGEEG
jgi:hypothetical protein